MSPSRGYQSRCSPSFLVSFLAFSSAFLLSFRFAVTHRHNHCKSLPERGGKHTSRGPHIGNETRAISRSPSHGYYSGNCIHRRTFEPADYPDHDRLGALAGTYLHQPWMHARFSYWQKSTLCFCVRWFIPVDGRWSWRKDMAGPMLSHL